MLTQRLELESAGYVFDDAIRIWRRDVSSAFGYSDGDEVEQSLARILLEATDLSVLSPELAAHCTDWPRRYHLSASRANLLRPLSHRLTGDILEIGAGCGAITRYLGECGGSVLALEGSRRRASIAALRTRDLPNVVVLNERFGDFAVDRKFDVVTLIGVLEYAALFGDGEDPAHSMLETVCRMLKPGGILILAIENQLGLKYLAGAPEDHLGIPMFGVQGLYQKPGVETFGKLELERRLAAAGFRTRQLALPFPDYKLPSSVLLPAALESRTRFHADTLAAQTATRDPQVNSKVLTFALERAWRTVGCNGLLADLANSFLFVASPSEAGTSPFEPDVLAFHYSSERQPAFCKAAAFVRHDEVVQVQRRLLSGATPASDSVFAHRMTDEMWIEGVALDEDFGSLLTTPGWSIRQVANIAHRYVEALFAMSGARVARPPRLTPDFEFPGDMLDVVPQNIIIASDGTPRAIDQEWSSREALPVGYLVFRALTLMLRSTSTCALPADLRWLNRCTFYAETFAHLGMDLTQPMIKDYLEREARFMSFAVGRTIDPEDLTYWLDAHLPSQLDLHVGKTSELKARNVELSNTVLQLRADYDDLQSREVKALESSKEAQLAELRMRAELDEVVRSRMWRTTRSLITVVDRLKRILG
ncbi:bifunctional 2-polyprenyl-6-hydroxyphenol methylase/3-demethylubiquinol 3-O-methyltransferase UbiG [Burkholderia sp. Bp9015]|uniref:class I SAM-dependent methyltransferase n=1 Tax=Burkholderia sp. Bp9015 TaxID=2184563 RepID=UPI000F5B15BF|nr:class I SAM-dependent methyltransferase [Burkholderia sp. Bp9015]RQR67952.1 class I SAM-dependent methyltransferase [Burkholderia sp. Bp9015]